MTLDDIPLFSALKSKLGYLNQREKLISQNVANSDTPGYHPTDLQSFAIPNSPGAGIGAPLMLAPAQTSAVYLPGDASSSSSSAWRPQASPDSETRMDGNQVVLEEEMMKLTDARMDYDTAIGFYQKSLSMLQTAIRTPGKG